MAAGRRSEADAQEARAEISREERAGLLHTAPPFPMQTRRSALKQLAAAGTALAMPSAAPASEPPIVQGRTQQSIVPWCFKPMTVPELAEHAAAMKFRSVELCPPEHWPRLKELGLTCAIASSHGFARGFA